MLASKWTQSWLAIIGTPSVCVGTLAHLYLPIVLRLLLEPGGVGTATVIQYVEAFRLTIFSPFRSRMSSFLMALNAILISGSPIEAGTLPLLALSRLWALGSFPEFGAGRCLEARTISLRRCSMTYRLWRSPAAYRRRVGAVMLSGLGYC